MSALDQKIAAFIQQGVAAAVSCCNAELQPSMARVLGTRVASDDCITVLLSRSQNAPLLRDALPGGKIAAVFCLPENECALQIKGVITDVAAPHADDWTRVLDHRVAFADQIEPKGYAREFSDYYHAATADELVALSFVPQEIFEQTPGPQAGRSMSPA